MLKRRQNYLLAVVILLLLNFGLIWYYISLTRTFDSNSITQNEIDLTILICSFEEFENNIAATVHHFNILYPKIKIFIYTPNNPYPHIPLTGTNAKIIKTDVDFTSSRYFNDPLRIITTEFVLILPDASRITTLNNSSLAELLWEYKSQKFKHVMAVPVIGEIKRCIKIEFDRKLWSLKYTSHNDLQRCEAFSDQVGLLMTSSLLRKLPKPFMKPFEESLYLQCKFLNVTFKVLNTDFFYLGKILYSSSHNKWKHENNLEISKRDLYKQLGVKYFIDDTGKERYFGCDKNTPRCFPTVIDVPKYLYQRKWTPPCCLKALRETAKHVFKIFSRYQLRYWLEGGSLLGAARNNDIIPWDYDVDIGMYLNDITKYGLLKDVWDGKSRTDDEGYVWQKANEGDFIRVQYSAVNHLHVDIFPFYERNGMMTKNTWFKSHRQDREFPEHYLMPMYEMMFVGVPVSVPNNYRQFLELKFGKGVIENPQYPFPEKLSAML